MIHADRRLYLVFEYLDLDLKKLMDILPGFNADHRLIKVRLAAPPLASLRTVRLMGCLQHVSLVEAVQSIALAALHWLWGWMNAGRLLRAQSTPPLFTLFATHTPHRLGHHVCCVLLPIARTTHWPTLVVDAAATAVMHCASLLVQLYLWQMLSGIAYCHSRR